MRFVLQVCPSPPDRLCVIERTDPTADLTFSIIADPGGATMLWEETHPNVVVENGLFTVIRGSTVDFPSVCLMGRLGI